MKLAHSLQFTSKGIQTKRVAGTTCICPDMPSHQSKIVTQGFHASGGTAIPSFGQILRDVNNVSLHETTHARRNELCIGLLGTEILNPQVTEKISQAGG